MEDNHTGEIPTNERGGYYDEWYDQTEEIKSDLFDVLSDIPKDREENIDNIYNEIADD